jgi:uncharacterized protein YjbJ (UPF0337 family)
MNWDRIEGNWKQVAGKVKDNWGKLTADDLDVVKGKRDQLVARIQERYGIAHDEADKQVRDWERNMREAGGQLIPRPHRPAVYRDPKTGRKAV